MSLLFRIKFEPHGLFWAHDMKVNLREHVDKHDHVENVQEGERKLWNSKQFVLVHWGVEKKRVWGTLVTSSTRGLNQGR